MKYLLLFFLVSCASHPSKVEAPFTFAGHEQCAKNLRQQPICRSSADCDYAVAECDVFPMHRSLVKQFEFCVAGEPEGPVECWPNVPAESPGCVHGLCVWPPAKHNALPSAKHNALPSAKHKARPAAP